MPRRKIPTPTPTRRKRTAESTPTPTRRKRTAEPKAAPTRRKRVAEPKAAPTRRKRVAEPKAARKRVAEPKAARKREPGNGNLSHVAIWEEFGEPESVVVGLPTEPTGRIGVHQENAIDFIKSRGRKKTTAQQVIDSLDVDTPTYAKYVVGRMLYRGKLEAR